MGMRSEQSSSLYQRLDVALDRVVVPTQVSHETQAGHRDVIIMRLAVDGERERERYFILFNRRFQHHFAEEKGFEFSLHVCHEEGDELVNVVRGVEYTRVVC